MGRFCKGWLALLLGWLLIVGGAAAQPVATLDSGVKSLQLTPHVSYHHDADGRAEAAAMFALAHSGGFAPLPPNGPTFGFKGGAFWFRAQIVNRDPDEPRWVLLQQYALSDYLDLYLRYPDGRIEHQAGGDMLPFSTRPIRYRQPNMLVSLRADEPVELLLRVQSQSSMQVPLALYTPTAFAELARDTQFGQGIYYGILLALLVYNLVLWFWLRDTGYLWYTFHVAAFGFNLISLYGLGFEYLWPNWPWLADKSIPLSISIALLAMQQFARYFLELPQRWPVGNRISLGFIAFFLLWAGASLVLPYRITTFAVAVMVFPSVTWLVVESVVLFRRGYAPAKLFMLAWALFLLGITAFTAIAFGLVPKTFFTEYGVQLGSAAEMLLLSVALGYRYAGLREENERVVREANEQLERKVAARTTELSSAMAQLNDANAQLREYSRRDPLTGSYNRRHFREVFEQQLRDGLDRGQSLGLLMADLDNFKQINDNYGHLVGDECLRAVARCFNEALVDRNAMVARFGGEEFVTVLPGIDAQGALQAAELVRQRILNTPVYSGRRHVHLSISIGVHTVMPDRTITPEDALRLADEALYRAKNDGRNCVRHSVSAA